MSIRNLENGNCIINATLKTLTVCETVNIDLNQIQNISDTPPNNGEVLTYNTGTLQWQPAPSTGEPMAMNDLIDVNAPDPPENSVLYHNGSEYVSSPAGVALGDVLTSQGAGLPLAWVSARDNQNLGDHYNCFFSSHSKGQLISRMTDNDTWETVNIGNEADALTVSASGVIRWADISSRPETLTNKTIDRQNNGLKNVYDVVHVDRLKNTKILVDSIDENTFIDGSPLGIGNTVLVIGNDDSNPVFSSVYNGVYLANASGTLPTRLDVSKNASTQKYVILSGDSYEGSVWMSNAKTGNDIAGVDSLFYYREDNPAKLYGSIYLLSPSYSQTLNALPNVYDTFTGFDAGGVTSSSVQLNLTLCTITPPSNREDLVYNVEYNLSWSSSTVANKLYTFAIFKEVDLGTPILLEASRTSRQLPNNDFGVTGSSSFLTVEAGTSVTLYLAVKCDVSSANIIVNGGHFRIHQVN